jgi:glycine cleavage system transcriptional repressor
MTMQALLISCIGQWRADFLAQCCQTVQECGGQIQHSRLLRTADQAIFALQVVGSWDAIAKLEPAFARLAQHADIRCLTMRTSPTRSPEQPVLPYIVEAMVPPDLDFTIQLVQFFHAHQLEVMDLQSQPYNNPQTQVALLSVTATIYIPAAHSLALLRNDFIDLCDTLNVDAILAPLR